MSIDNQAHDVMQVCRNGHVITERMHSRPEQQRNHCPQCGAGTLYQCPTCGEAIPGAMRAPGMVPVGERSIPNHCSRCGASLPWASSPSPTSNVSLAVDQLLRRLPRTIHTLRSNSDAPTFRVRTDGDLEHLLRAVLPLCCDEVRTQRWAPAHSPRSRLFYVLLPEKITLSAQMIGADVDLKELEKQLRQDAIYHKEQQCSQGVLYVYDPKGALPNPQRLESLWSQTWDVVTVKCIIAS